MAEDHSAPETGQLFRAWIEVVERQRVAKLRVAQRVRSRTMQNEIRDVQRRMSVDAA